MGHALAGTLYVGDAAMLSQAATADSNMTQAEGVPLCM